MGKIKLVRDQGSEFSLTFTEDLELKDPDLFREKVGNLVALFNNVMTEDCGIRRSMSELFLGLEGGYEHVHECVLRCVDNDTSYFEKKAVLMDVNTRASLCSIAALVGSFGVLSTLFNESVNAGYVALCTICSRDTGGVKAFVEKTNADIISGGDFLHLAEKLGNQDLVQFFSEKKSQKESQQAAVSAGLFSGAGYAEKRKAKVTPIPMSGELLESFNELLRGELDGLAEIKDEGTKRLLLSAIVDLNLSAADVGRFSVMKDRVIGRRLAMLASCIFPDRWAEDFVQPYKKAVIDSYVDRFIGEDVSQKKGVTAWLIVYAQAFVAEYLKESGLLQSPLSEEERSEKAYILEELRKESLQVEASELLADEEHKLSAEIKKIDVAIHEVLYDDKENIPLGHHHARGLAEAVPQGAGGSLSKMFSKDNWPKIYDLVKLTPSGRVRSEALMKEVLQTIAYKEDEGRRWKEVLAMDCYRNAPSARYYERVLRSKGLMDQIRATLAGEQSSAAPRFGKAHD